MHWVWRKPGPHISPPNHSWSCPRGSAYVNGKNPSRKPRGHKRGIGYPHNWKGRREEHGVGGGQSPGMRIRYLDPMGVEPAQGHCVLAIRQDEQG